MSKTLLSIAGAALALMPAAPALAAGSGGDATSVPEPADAVLVLMGAAGVIIGRRLHARSNDRKD